MGGAVAHGGLRDALHKPPRRESCPRRAVNSFHQTNDHRFHRMSLMCPRFIEESARQVPNAFRHGIRPGRFLRKLPEELREEMEDAPLYGNGMAGGTDEGLGDRSLQTAVIVGNRPNHAGFHLIRDSFERVAPENGVLVSVPRDDRRKHRTLAVPLTEQDEGDRPAHAIHEDPEPVGDENERRRGRDRHARRLAHERNHALAQTAMGSPHRLP